MPQVTGAVVTVQCRGCSADESAEVRRVLEETYEANDVVVEVRLSRDGAIYTIDYAMETDAVGGPGQSPAAPAPRDATARVRAALQAAGRQVV